MPVFSSSALARECFKKTGDVFSGRGGLPETWCFVAGRAGGQYLKRPHRISFWIPILNSGETRTDAGLAGLPLFTFCDVIAPLAGQGHQAEGMALVGAACQIPTSIVTGIAEKTVKRSKRGDFNVHPPLNCSLTDSMAGSSRISSNGASILRL